MGNENGASGSAASRVTVIVTPRERFGLAQRSLESIYAASDIPFELVYIDARSPRYVSSWLRQAAPAKGFRVLHLGRFVTPNEARNLGAAAASTEFVVFIDNDVICADGWLGTLVKAADETGAEVVAPLICEGSPLHSRIHQATGKFAGDKSAFFSTPYGQREMVDVMAHHKVPLETVRDELRRTETDVVEFHCLLMRRAFLEKMGRLDEDMYATREHIDFSMSVLKAGGRLVFEPNSIVTYVFPNSANPMNRHDLPYFFLRWSPQWQVHSLDHLRKKWGLRDDGEFGDFRSPQSLRWRHNEGFVKPMIRRMPVIRSSWRLSQMAQKFLTRYVDRKVERLAAEYEKQRSARSATG